MRFKRKEILFWEGQIVISLCLLVSAILMLYNGNILPILLFLSVLLIIAILLQLLLDKEYITMDEEGITCQKGSQLSWQYNWSVISELKIGNRFRNPSVEIVLRGDCYNNCDKYESSKVYFQLGLTARKAIKLYCKCPVTKM